jgi:hypothetical protein
VRSPALDVVSLLAKAHPDEIERSLHAADHVARAFAETETALPAFDRLHGARDGGPARDASAILGAAPHFKHRLPKVFGGYAAAETSVPVAYPTASRPQAWAAGTPLLLTTMLDLQPGGDASEATAPGVVLRRRAGSTVSSA